MTEENNNARFARLENKIDRLLNEIDFIKNRTSAYLGDDIGLTYLIDETPIYINTNDFGCPSNFINGGRYEEDYIAVLASFCKPNSVFLDIGANLGVFSLRLASRMKHGKIFAFEPNPKINDLLSRSVFLSGCGHIINVCKFGLSDTNTTLRLSVPTGHAGGASVREEVSAGSFEIDVKRLDDWLPTNIKVDVIKLDVEGHELKALKGMISTLRRSTDAVIIFEKLQGDSGIEAGLHDIFTSVGMSIYRVDGTSLTEVTLAEMTKTTGYFLAARPHRINDEFQRNFIYVYPEDMNVRLGAVVNDALVVDQNCVPNSIVFYGPYWYLPRGTYQIAFDADIKTDVKISITEKFGFHIDEFILTPDKKIVEVAIHRDLNQFELVGRSITETCQITVRHIKLVRIG